MPLLNNYPTLSGFLGLAVEAITGTPVAAKSYIPLLDEDIQHDPGLIVPKMLRGTRQSAYVGVVAQQKVGGKISVPLYVDQGVELLACAVGNDTYQSNGASTGSVALSASPSAGAASISLAAQTGTPIAASDYVEIRQISGAASIANLSEIHKVLSVSGVGPYTVTFAAGETLNRAYVSATATVYRIAGATTNFTHYLYPDQPSPTYYKTLTLEKGRAGMDSRQHGGSAVKKLDLKLDPKNFGKIDYEITSLTDTSVSSTVPSFGTSAPLSLGGYSVSLFGSADTSVTSFDLTLDNGNKEYWTFNASATPTIAPPLERKVTGKWTNIVQSGTYYANSIAGTTGVVALTMAGTAGSSIVVNLPTIQITKLSDPLKLGEVFMYDVEFQALNAGGTSGDINVVVTNGNWLSIAN